MHRQDTLTGQQIVHDAKNRLFGLACVTGAANNDQLTREVNDNERRRICAIDCRIRSESRRVNDREAGFMSCLFLIGTCNKHVASESTMPGELVNNSHRQTTVGIRACKTILHKQLLAFEVIDHTREQGVKLFRLVWDVNLAPPNFVLSVRVTNHKLVVGRASCMRSCLNNERACDADQSLTFSNSVLCQLSLIEVPMYRPQITKSVIFKAMGTMRFCVGHHCSLNKQILSRVALGTRGSHLFVNPDHRRVKTVQAPI